MTRALELAARGQGWVEPNPMVGCVIARGSQVLGEGYHTRYGAPHAEVEALRVAGSAAAGATMYVTLEPCCHHGKTPPCTDAVIRAGLRRAVVAHRDPFPQVAGGGLDQLERAGLAVEVGLLESQVRHLNAPYLKLVEQGRPWVIAKWAMTLDGKIATCAGDSRWISGEASRTRVHQMRGRVDAIVVGYRTAVADDPLLTARPSGPRIATRIVVDPRAGLPLRSRLARTARETPVLIAVDATASDQNRRHLFEAGCEVWGTESLANATGLTQLLEELGRRRMTNVVVEGGGRLLGRLFDAQLIDEVHVFIASKLVGGADAPSPVAGFGIERMSQAVRLVDPQFEHLDGDLYLHGRLQVNP